MFYDKKVSVGRRERKQLCAELSIKSVDDSGRIAGYASVVGIVDNQHDVIERGAFRSSIGNGASHIKMLWQHQQDEPIGLFHRIFEDHLGLYVEGQLLLDVQKAKEAYCLLKAGVISGLSIGYSPVRYRIDPDTGVRYLSEVDLWEISLVTFPANNGAHVTVVKRCSNHEDLEWRNAQCTGAIVELSNMLDSAIKTLIR